MDAGKQLDSLLERVAKERSSRGPEPDLDHIWLQISRKIKVERRTHLLRTASILITVFMIFFGFFYVLHPTPVKGAGKMLWRFLSGISIEPDIVMFVPTEQNAGLQQPLAAQINSIKGKCPFPVLIPAYIPPEFKIALVSFTPSGENGGEVQLYYEAGEGFLIFTQWSGTSWENIYMSDTSGTVMRKYITVKGVPAQLTYDEKEKKAALIWAEGRISYHLGGTVSPSEILQIAHSIR